MKKWIFRILKFVGAIAVLYLVVALFSPSEYRVECNHTYTTSKEVLFEQVGFFENWLAWSPWVAKDTAAKYTTTGDGAVGAKQSWIGNPDSVGTGNMLVTEWVENEKILYDLTFEGMGMTSHGGMELTENEDGTINIKWFDEGVIPFFFRPMMLFMNIEDKIAPDFEKGLKNIEAVAIAKQEELDAQANYVISEIDFPESYYYGITYELKMEEVDSNLFGTAYGQIGESGVFEHTEMTGAPVCLTFVWDEETGRCKLMPAMKVADNSKAVQGIESYTIKASKALSVDYYGEYEMIWKAHVQMDAYLAENNLDFLVSVEEYVTDPATVDSPDQVLTKVYYILK